MPVRLIGVTQATPLAEIISMNVSIARPACLMRSVNPQLQAEFLYGAADSPGLLGSVPQEGRA